MPIALSPPRWTDLSPRLVNLLLGVMLVLIVGAFAVLASLAWQRESESASVEASNIAAFMAQNIGRAIELSDLSIQDARSGVLNPTIMAAPTQLRDAVLFDRAATASYLGEIMVLAPNGDVLASSSSTPVPGGNDAARDYFRIHALSPDCGLYVSGSLTPRSGSERVIALSRRITRGDGSFGGVVVGTLRLDYVRQLFPQSPLGHDLSLALFRGDGTLIMREPFDPDAIGPQSVAPNRFDFSGRSAEGEYVAPSTADDVSRLYHFRRIGALPLIAIVGRAASDVHVDWWRRAIIMGGVIALGCGCIVLLMRQLSRELGRRIEAEAKLLMLVDTDGLTGLANRRCFDRVLASEWQRACHNGLPLSLLMIDADHFKEYNDLYGHAAGDELLRQVGRCLAFHSNGPGLLAARYGGEEFAVILPGFEGGAACEVAEAMRRGIMELDISHPGSSLGSFTVSIGCASTVPAFSTTCVALATAADVALYRSKRAGRNTVVWQDATRADARLAS